MSSQQRERTRSAWIAGVAAWAALAGAARGQDPLWTESGVSSTTQLGWGGVALIGDLNGDGTLDVAVSEGPVGGTTTRLLDGRTGAQLFAPFTPDARPVRCGDLNGDSIEELLLDHATLYETQVHSGKTGLRVRSIPIDHPVVVGDVDGDGVTDIAGYAAVWSTTAGRLLGEVRLISGKTGATLLVIAPSGRLDLFGRGVAAMGDWNGDGVPDLAATVDGSAAATLGDVALFSLAGGAAIGGATGLPWSFSLGVPLTAVGDLDGDGVVDLIVSNPDELVAGNVNAGAVRIVSGATLALLGRFDGEAAFDRVHAIGGVGDLDGDALPEFALGSLFSTLAWIRSGRTFGRLYGVHTEAPFPFGARLAGGGDLDGDGFGDLVFADPTKHGVVSAERGRVVFVTADPAWRFRPGPLKGWQPALMASGLPGTSTRKGGPLEKWRFQFHGANLLPGSPVSLRLLEQDGAPVNVPLATGVASGSGEWDVDVLLIPNDALPHDYGAALIGTDRHGQAVTSNLERFSYR